MDTNKDTPAEVVDELTPIDALYDINAELRAEVERLRTELRTCQETLTACLEAS